MTFVLAFLVFALAIAGLALGVMLGRPALRGSCGGAGGCELCSRRGRCREDERVDEQRASQRADDQANQQASA